MIQRFFEGLAGLINRRPRLVALLVVAIFCTGIVGMTQVRMETGWTTYIDANSAQGVVQSTYTEYFQSDAIILIVETANPLDPGIVDYLDRLERDIGQQKHISSTGSIVEVLKAYHGGTLPTSQVEINRIVSALPADLRAKAVPSNLLTLVEIQLDSGLSTPTENAVLANVESIVASSDPPPGVQVKISGSPAFTQQMRAGLSANMGILIGGAMILMIVVMGVLFAYVRYRFLPVLLVAVGLVSSLGLMGLAGIQLNMAVVGAFPVLIGLGIDYAIQFHARFDEEARKGSLADAVFYTVTRTGPAVLYAMLATCMGFLAMFVAEVPMIRSFGLVAIIGIFTCYWVSCIGMPTLGLLLGYRPKGEKREVCYAVGTGACDTALGPVEKGREGGKVKKGILGSGSEGALSPPNGPGFLRNPGSFSYGQFLTDVSVKIARNPVPVLLIAGFIAFAGFQLDAAIPVQSNENAFVPPDMPAKINIDKVTRILGSTTTAAFSVEGRPLTDLDTVKWLKDFQDHELASHSELTGSTSIVTPVLAYNGGGLPETQSQLDTVLDRIPQATKDLYLHGSLGGVVQFTTIDLEMSQQEALKEQMVKDIAFLEPPIGVSVVPTGSFDIYTTLMSTLTESKELMTGLGFLFVFLFLAIVYRHIHAVSPIIPIILIVGWNAVAMFTLGIAYTPITATLGSMAIGVAAEYTILVMERYGEEEDRLHDPLAAIQESVHRIGTAITVSGLATFFGFSALCLSTFPILANFGVTTLIAVAFSLAGAIFIMPAVLSLMGRVTVWLDARKAASGGMVRS
ncbi:MAG TPA: hydrophobe/amphiphile efflux-3 (HAE3) family transporter [Methanomicrobiales archaeon]|nr:hydrophobe/amphiphile efflux-3 (HAE3) family transporter [Methanomicrobiales archaeon]